MASMAPPNEPTNAALMALLQQHMTVSQAESRERAKENEAIRLQIGIVDSRVQTLTNKQLELEQRQTRLERSQEQTHGIAISARESHDELHGVVMRELTNMKRETSHQSTVLATHTDVLAHQNEDLATIRTDTKELVQDAKYRREERTRWKARLAFIYAAAKFIGAIAVAAGAVYGVTEVILSHIK